MIELSDINFDALGSMSAPAKLLVTGACCLLLVVAGYTLDTKPQLNKLVKGTQDEHMLKNEFEMKYHLASNKAAYEAQLQDIEGAYSMMLNQLPSVNELPQLGFVELIKV